MSGYVSSWIEQYTTSPITCANQPPVSVSSSCLVWLVVGLVLGSLTFEKKHKVQK